MGGDRVGSPLTSAPVILVSFDIDGTMEFGDPPGPVTLDHVRRARELGYVIGSASDRTVRDQQELWDRHGIVVDFVGHKHMLDGVRERFEMSRYMHIGDTNVDEFYALKHGFEFTHVEHLPADGSPGWLW